MRYFPHLITGPFEALDALRRWQGAVSDALLPPKETPHRIFFHRSGVRLRHYGRALPPSAPLLLVIPAPIKGPAICSALHPERVRALVLLEAPLHFGPDSGALASLIAALPWARRFAGDLHH